MKFNIIDLKNWERQRTFEHFYHEVPCTYSINGNIDITNLMREAKENNLKIFPTIIFHIAYIVNRHSEFRMSKDENGNIGYYENLDPSFTVFHDETKTFTNVWTAYNNDFNGFYKNYLEDMLRYGNNKTTASKPVVDSNTFDISCIPWVSFTGFNLNLKNSYDYLLPIFTIGKYFEDNGKTKIPLAIQVHHAVCDGYHVANFINELQESVDKFSFSE